MRVLLLFFSSNSEYNNLDALLEILFQGNTRKNIVIILSHPTANFYHRNFLPSYTLNLLRSAYVEPLGISSFLLLHLPGNGIFPPGMLLSSSTMWYWPSRSIFFVESMLLRKSNCVGNWVYALVYSLSPHRSLLICSCWDSNDQY